VSPFGFAKSDRGGSYSALPHMCPFLETAGVCMIFASRGLASPLFELVGQIHMVFSAVVGGTLFGAGWGELRRHARIKQAHKDGC